LKKWWAVEGLSRKTGNRLFNFPSRIFPPGIDRRDAVVGTQTGKLAHPALEYPFYSTAGQSGLNLE